MNLRNILFLSFILLLGPSCKKDCSEENMQPDGYVAGHPLDSLGLPHATTEGLNTMGCLVNGEVWLPLKPNILGDLVYHVPFSITGEGDLNISAFSDLENDERAFLIAAEDIQAIGFYPLISNFFDDNTSCGFFNLDSTYNNYLFISEIDFSTEIISGQFGMRLVNPDCDTLNITDGRFDLSSE